MDQEYLQLIEEIKKASNSMMKYFGSVLELEGKSNAADFRTKADTETEDQVIEAIKEIFPEYNIFAEERGEIDNGSEYRFIIDPLDGTNNFALGIPNFATSVALMKGTKIIFGVIHNPVTDVSYYAIKGEGAFMKSDDKEAKLNVSKSNSLDDAYVYYTCTYTTPIENIAKVIKNLILANTKRVLNSWSPAYHFCLLAQGKIDALVNGGCELYDYAAGKLIAMEAGAKVTNFDGTDASKTNANIENGKLIKNDSDEFLISNGTKLHEEILDIIKMI